MASRYSREPAFIRKPRSFDVEEGDDVVIVCEVVGDPKPEVSWLRDWLKVSSATREERRISYPHAWKIHGVPDLEKCRIRPSYTDRPRSGSSCMIMIIPLMLTVRPSTEPRYNRLTDVW